jgi:phosphatidylglycerophosphatase A
VKIALASWFGTGLILRNLRGSDSGSGTLASVVTFPFAIWLGVWGIWAQIAAVVIVTAAAIWSIRPLVDDAGDASWIVIDEAAGTILAVISLGWLAGLVALIVFRLADIYKTRSPGVARAEDISGAIGIVADDLVAGIYGLGAGLLATLLLN